MTDICILTNVLNQCKKAGRKLSAITRICKFMSLERHRNLIIESQFRYCLKNKSLSLFHINACSLNKNFDDLQHLLSCTKKKFDIIAISETRTTEQVFLLNNLNLNNYSFEFYSISAGGTLLYIANHLSYKCRNDLNIYKKTQLGSTFIELLNPRKSNIIVGIIYKHPSMDLTDFNCNYLNKL